MQQYHIGISGWRYEPWRGSFYPKGLPQKRELEYASHCLNSIEINGSFYSLQRPSSYQEWYETTPDDFVFSLKGGQFITHIRRLRDVEIPLANFLASGVLCLKEKLGPILWQFPPNMKFDAERFESLFKLLPHTAADAVRLAKKHELKAEDRVWIQADADRPVRHAVEVRNESFKTPEFVELAAKYDVAIVVADTAGKWPYFEDVTSDFLYVRLHGEEELYVSGYTDDALDHWARRIKLWSRGSQPDDAKLVSPDMKPRHIKSRDVFCYFDNDVKVRSPADAIRLAERLGITRTCSPDYEVGKVDAKPRASWPLGRPGAAKKRRPRRKT